MTREEHTAELYEHHSDNDLDMQQISLVATTQTTGRLEDWPLLYYALKRRGCVLPNWVGVATLQPLCQQILNESPT